MKRLIDDFCKALWMVFLAAAVCYYPAAVAQSTGYGVDGATGNWVSMPIPAATPVTTIGPTTANGQGGDFAVLFQSGFFTTQNGTLVTIFPTVGVASPIGPVTGLSSGQTIVGMGFSVAGSTMYLATTNLSFGGSELYTINIGNGAATLVGTITNAPFLLAIAVDCNGNIFGFDDGNDNLISIDPATGAGTVIGSLGVDAGPFAQDADFDPPTGILYWTHFNGTSGELRSVNVNTGASTLVSTWGLDLGSFGIFGDCSPTGLNEGGAPPQGFELLQNFPNPFNPVTEIQFSLAKNGHVTLVVYDLLGREVKSLVSENLTAGSHTVQWDGTDERGLGVAGGVYLYRLSSGEQSSVKKLVLMR